MGKQTMGVAVPNQQYRSDNKGYRLTHGQYPVVRTRGHVDYGMDALPNGCNAVVAVLAYTGYDMEDAMIINKSSYERGFAHACVFYTVPIDLKDEAPATDLFFAVDPAGKRPAHIDDDGLPLPGSQLYFGDVLATYYNRRTKTVRERERGGEDIVFELLLKPFCSITKCFARSRTWWSWTQCPCLA